MKSRFAELTAQSSDLGKIKQALRRGAQQIHLEKKATDEAIAATAPNHAPEGQVMTQCNAGALATGGIGTALGVIRVAFEQEKKSTSWSRKRAPIQGARLTAGSCTAAASPPRSSPTTWWGHFLKSEKWRHRHGADTHCRQRRHRQQIGTYQIAVLAKKQCALYVAAPVSTFDLSIPNGDHIPIEERTADEVTHIQGVRIAPDVPAAHPPFDVTPARYIAASSPNAA